MTPAVPWEEFSQDPRRPEAAGLRAGDRDRDVVLRVLADGYADGRLTKEEYDERADATAASKTLGELPALIADLVPPTPPGGGSALARATPDVLHQRAVQRWEAQRRQALSGFLIPTLICWVVWFATGTSFPWPVFVMLGTGVNVLRVLMHKQDIILEEQRRLERKQRRALEPPKQRRPPAAG
jgi:hypothetical protein